MELCQTITFAILSVWLFMVVPVSGLGIRLDDIPCEWEVHPSTTPRPKDVVDDTKARLLLAIVIALAVVLALICFIAVVFAVWFFCMRPRNRRDEDQHARCSVYRMSEDGDDHEYDAGTEREGELDHVSQLEHERQLECERELEHERERNVRNKRNVLAGLE